MKIPSLPKGWKRRNRPTLGLDIGSHTIKLVELAGTGKNRTVRRLGMALCPPEAIIDGVAIALQKFAAKKIEEKVHA